jgi:hypothetical protein
MAQDDVEQPVIAYILGVSFCGSTLLNTLLDRHSQMVGLNELVQLGRFVRGTDPRFDPLRLPFWQHVKQRYEAATGKSFADIDIQQTRKTARKLTPAGKQEWQYINEMLYSCISEVASVPVLVDSSKGARRLSMLHGSPVTSRFRVIHMVRDGRASLYSTLRRGNSFSRRLLHWYALELQAISLRRKYPHWLQVHYEDLATDPESTLKRICAFLSIEYEPQMLQPSDGEFVGIGGKGVGMANDKTLAITLKEDWKTNLSRKHKILFTLLGSWLNKYHGYSIT